MMMKSCPRCGRLMPYGPKYCRSCTEEVERLRAERLKRDESGAKRERQRRYNAKRDPKYTKFYKGADWRRLSAWTLQRDRYRCAACGGIATEVDHVVPIQTPEGWDRRLDPSNLQSLCHRCHDEKHGRFQPRARRG